MSIINSHNSWSKLEEVWLGDVYPARWYDHLPQETQDVFYKLTEITKEDLQTIQNTIESFGVRVRRPTYKNINSYIELDGQLRKPQICPRDQFIVLGNSLIAHNGHTMAWQQVLDEYDQDKTCKVLLTNNEQLNGANIVRLNERLIIDSPRPKKNQVAKADKVINDCIKNYKVDFVYNGGHLDACFAILKPGLILASKYFPDYDKFFPGWQKIILEEPEFAMHIKQQATTGNNKWWLPSFEHNQSFNDHIIQHAHDWVGNYTETYFELNCLVIDESNIIMLGENLALEKTLKKHAINITWAPFRTRSFWDGGLHCLTVDIRRNSKKLTQ